MKQLKVSKIKELGAFVPAAFAIALFLFWEQALFRVSLPVSATLSFGSYESTRLDLGWLAFMVAILASASAIALRVKGRGEGAPFSTAAVAVASAFGAAGSILVLFFPSLLLALVLGGAMAGAGSVVIACALIDFSLRSLNREETFVGIFMAGLLLAVIGLVGAVVPSVVILVLLVVCPVLCSVLACRANAAGSVRKEAPVSNVEPNEIRSSVEKRGSKVAAISCFLACFIVVLYTNITGFRYNAFSAEEYYLHAMMLACFGGIGLSAALFVMHRLFKSDDLLPAIVLTSVTAMLIASLAIDVPWALFIADAVASVGRLLALLFVAFSAVKLVRLGPAVRVPAAIATGSCAVLVSVVFGALIYFMLGSQLNGNIMLVTSVLLYALLLASNAISTKRADSVTVTIKGSLIGDAELAEYRAHALSCKYPSLTAKEVEVIRLLLLGYNAESVATDMVISANTAKTHIRHIYKKLGIHSRQELIMAAQSITRVEEG